MIGLIGSLCAQCTSPAPTSDSPAPTTVAAPAKGKVSKITQAEFAKKIFNYNDPQALYTGKTPVVVDCYADWCGPCRALAPTVEELAAEYEGKVIFYKLNVDNAKELSKALQITSIPTLLFIKPNTPPQRSVGLVDKATLTKAIDEFLLDQSTDSSSNH
jgi:thioredoxin